MQVLAAGDTAGENSLAAEASLSEPTLSSAWRLSTRPCSKDDKRSHLNYVRRTHATSRDLVQATEQRP